MTSWSMTISIESARGEVLETGLDWRFMSRFFVAVGKVGGMAMICPDCLSTGWPNKSPYLPRPLAGGRIRDATRSSHKPWPIRHLGLRPFVPDDMRTALDIAVREAFHTDAGRIILTRYDRISDRRLPHLGVGSCHCSGAGPRPQDRAPVAAAVGVDAVGLQNMVTLELRAQAPGIAKGQDIVEHHVPASVRA